jgi:hypothetical protein
MKIVVLFRAFWGFLFLGFLFSAKPKIKTPTACKIIQYVSNAMDIY